MGEAGVKHLAPSSYTTNFAVCSYRHNRLSQQVESWHSDLALVAALVTPTGRSGHLHGGSQGLRG